MGNVRWGLGQLVPMTGAGVPGITGFAPDGTSAYIAVRFFAKSTSPITTVRFYVTALGNTDLDVTLETLNTASSWLPSGTDVGGGGSPTKVTIPNASIAIGVVSATLTNAWTPTLGQAFCATIRPSTYTSAHTMRVHHAGAVDPTSYHFMPVTSTNAGTVTRGGGTTTSNGLIEIVHQNGEVDGLLVTTVPASGLFGGNSNPDEIGVKWTQPVTATLCGLEHYARFGATSATWYLYDSADNVLWSLANSFTYYENNVIRPTVVPVAPGVVLKAGQVYRMALKETSAATNTSAYANMTLNTIPTWDYAQPVETTRNNGGAWTDNTTTIQGIRLLFSDMQYGAPLIGGGKLAR